MLKFIQFNDSSYCLTMSQLYLYPNQVLSLTKLNANRVEELYYMLNLIDIGVF